MSFKHNILGYGLTTNDDLTKYAHKINLHLLFCNFKDLLPQFSIPKNGCYIINLASKSDKSGGTHWTSLYIDNTGAVYFDSFGQPPSIEVENFIKKRFKTYIYNKKQIQKLNSNYCGQYCILFLYMMTYCKGSLEHKLKELQNTFN